MFIHIQTNFFGFVSLSELENEKSGRKITAEASNRRVKPYSVFSEMDEIEIKWKIDLSID